MRCTVMFTCQGSGALCRRPKKIPGLHAFTIVPTQRPITRIVVRANCDACNAHTFFVWPSEAEP